MRSPRLFSFLGNQSNRPRQGQTSVLFYRFNHYDYRCKTPKTGGPVSEKNSSRNCLINSWRALSTLVLSDTRRPNRAPSHRSTPWWDPRIGPVSIYQTVSRAVILGNPVSDKRASRKSSFVLCSASRAARSICYTGLSSQGTGVSRIEYSRKPSGREESRGC